jgi:hypothetical protein
MRLPPETLLPPSNPPTTPLGRAKLFGVDLAAFVATGVIALLFILAFVIIKALDFMSGIRDIWTPFPKKGANTPREIHRPTTPNPETRPEKRG